MRHSEHFPSSFPCANTEAIRVDAGCQRKGPRHRRANPGGTSACFLCSPLPNTHWTTPKLKNIQAVKHEPV